MIWHDIYGLYIIFNNPYTNNEITTISCAVLKYQQFLRRFISVDILNKCPERTLPGQIGRIILVVDGLVHLGEYRWCEIRNIDIS